MIVMKFGGTSVKDDTAIRRVISIVTGKYRNAFVVVSAFSGITNQLVEIVRYLKNQELFDAMRLLDSVFEKHHEVTNNLGLTSEVENFLKDKYAELKQLFFALDVLGEVSPKSTDYILAQGELLSSRIVFSAFTKNGHNTNFIDPRELIKTDSNFGEANVNFKETQKIFTSLMKKPEFNSGYIITGGFVASNPEGQTTVLGRGGSDYSASIIASSIAAEGLEIWTDVDGILTCDPRLVSHAKIIRELSYEEASELAYFGAKVLHPKTIYPAIQKQIAVWVKNTFNPDNAGTKIIGEKSGKKLIKAIAFRKGVSVINVNSNRMLGAYGFLSMVFEVFKKYETSVDIVTTSEVSISLTIDDDINLDRIKSELSKFAKVTVRKNQAIIAAIGEGIRDTAGIAAKFFGVLKGINISMVSIGGSEINISIIVADKDLENAVKLLHTEFFSGNLDKNIFYEIN